MDPVPAKPAKLVPVETGPSIYQELRPDAPNVPRKVPFGKFFPKRAPKREINFLTPEELKKLYASCVRARQRLLLPLIKFLANTGLRRSEALDLKWTDIDQESGLIQVRTSKTGKARNIPIEPDAWEAIKWLEGRGEYVFCYPRGKRPDKASFREPLIYWAKKAGITKRIDLHTMRHSYGSNKIRAGWGLKKVSMLLGHSDISMTANVYTHLLDGDLRVRDDFRFDRPDRAENSEEARSFASKVLAGLLAKATNDAGTLERIEAELDRVIAAAKSAPDAEKAAEIMRDLASFSENCGDLQGAAQKAVPAPHMLRGRDKLSAMEVVTEVGSSENLLAPRTLEAVKFGRGGEIRTHDLFVPNEAR